MYNQLVISTIICSLVVYVSGNDGCKIIKSKSYTTEDDLVMANKIGFITEFQIKCKSDKKPMFGVVDDKFYPVFRTKKGYQISWTEDREYVKTGNHEVRLFDEEQFSNYRKSQRAGEKPSAKELAQVYVRYSKNYLANFYFLSSKTLVSILSFYIAYVAIQNHAKIVRNA